MGKSSIITEFINNDTFITVIGVLLTSFFTYFFTRRITRKNMNHDIYNIQLRKIYWPLHNQVFNKNVNEINTDLLLKTLTQKSQKYNIYCSHKLIKFKRILSQEIHKNQVKKSTLKHIKYYIENEFIILKYKLGYPCSAREFFGNKYILFTVIKYIWLFIQFFFILLFGILFLLSPDIYEPDFYNFIEGILIVSILINLIYTFLVSVTFLINCFNWKYL